MSDIYIQQVLDAIISFKGKILNISFKENDSDTTISSLVIKDPTNPIKSWLIFLSEQYDFTIIIYDEDGKRIGYKQGINDRVREDSKLLNTKMIDLGSGFIKINTIILNIKDIVSQNIFTYQYEITKYNNFYAKFYFPGDGTVLLQPNGTIISLEDYCNLSYDTINNTLDIEENQYIETRLDSSDSLLRKILNDTVPIQYTRCPPMTDEELAKLQEEENKRSVCSGCVRVLERFIYPENNTNTMEIVEFFRELSCRDFCIRSWRIGYGEDTIVYKNRLVNDLTDVSPIGDEFFVLEKDGKQLCIRINATNEIWVWGHHL